MRRALLVAVVLAAFGASAKNEIVVDSRNVQTNDLVTVTISLEGSFAAIEEPRVPLRNLKFTGEPSVSTEFALINGDISRRKTFRFLVRPIAPGPALIGPVVLNADDGQHDTLAAVALQVLADRISGSNDAEAVLRELLAAGRPPVFVTAEVEKNEVFEGEPLLVSWYLYNAAAIQRWNLVGVPKLADFWVEELQRGEQPERVYVGQTMVQRMPIRRSLLVPLHSGDVHVEGMSVEASIMERTRASRLPFSIFEGTVVDTTFTSAPFEIHVKPIPPGPPVDAVGRLSLRCDLPSRKQAGPVVVRATLEGLGNLRAAAPPRFEKPVAGTVETQGSEVRVNAGEGGQPIMSRTWDFLIFPTSPGPLEIPSLTMRTFVPETGQRQELRCSASLFDVVSTVAASRTPGSPQLPGESPAPVRWPLLLGALGALAAAAVATRQVLATITLRRQVRALIAQATPEEIRARVAALVPYDPREASDRGDAWRALSSLLEAMERDRDLGENSETELRRRVREVLRYVPAATKSGARNAPDASR
jgi:hypothetical protein